MCEITQGKTKLCRTRFGGVVGFIIGEIENIASVTAADGEVTAMTMKPGKRAWTFKVEDGTSNFKDSGAGNRQAGTYVNTQTAIVSNNDFELETVNSAMEISEATGLFIVVLYKNGARRLAGLSVDRSAAPAGRGTVDLDISGGFQADTEEHDSGTNGEDMAGEVWTLTAKENRKPLKISKAISDSLLSVAS